MALVVEANSFDRLFRGAQFDEFDCTALYVYAADEYQAVEIEDTYGPRISIIAADVLKCQVPIVMVLPLKLKQARCATAACPDRRTVRFSSCPHRQTAVEMPIRAAEVSLMLRNTVLV